MSINKYTEELEIDEYGFDKYGILNINNKHLEFLVETALNYYKSLSYYKISKNEEVTRVLQYIHLGYTTKLSMYSPEYIREKVELKYKKRIKKILLRNLLVKNQQ